MTFYQIMCTALEGNEHAVPEYRYSPSASLVRGRGEAPIEISLVMTFTKACALGAHEHAVILAVNMYQCVFVCDNPLPKHVHML